MVLKLFNTLGRAKQEFKLQKGSTVKLYTCGPTVYAYQHVGNYRTYLFEDTLKRTLLLNGFKARHIMNITDVGHLTSDADDGGDKIAKAAIRAHKTAFEIARLYEDAFKSDLKELNILPPTKYVRATDHIKDQIKLIKTLEKKNYIYKTSDGIYFNTSKLKNYGKLAPRSIKGLRAGERVAVGEKLNPTDFALWKFSSPSALKRDMEWASPWGIGFPGWHIECSAMSMRYLGSTLDIHCGGADHIQIHHTNEIAQSEAATGKPFSKFWMHAAFLTITGEKMAKSSPETNILVATLHERGFNPLDFRYLALGTHYRKPLSFGWEALKSARTSRLKILQAYPTLPKNPQKIETSLKKKFLEAINDDLNTSRALAIFWQGIKQGASEKFVLWCDHLLGLNIRNEVKNAEKEPDNITLNIKDLLELRETARTQKNWLEADALRQKITRLGYSIKDTPQGPLLTKL